MPFPKRSGFEPGWPKRKIGDEFNAVFCDVFIMKNGKINQLIVYLMEVKI